MTVSSTTSRKTFTGDGATVAFATSPMVFFDDADLEVYEVVTATGVATLKTITTDYTVSGGSGTTGTVTMVTAPASTVTLVIVRNVAATQGSDFVNNDNSDAEVVEDALDRLTMLAQQNANSVARSFALADSDVTGASTEIPTPAASKLIGWDSAGTALTNYAAASVADTIIPTAYMETVLAAATAAAARGVLAAGQMKLGSITRDMTAASGAVATTGVGFTPRLVIFMGSSGGGGTEGVSLGFDDGTNAYCILQSLPNVAGGGFEEITAFGLAAGSIALAPEVGKSQSGKITALGADGFTITWVKTSTPGAGNGTVRYIAFG